jgi:hypothetical protein
VKIPFIFYVLQLENWALIGEIHKAKVPVAFSYAAITDTTIGHKRRQSNAGSHD